MIIHSDGKDHSCKRNTIVEDYLLLHPSLAHCMLGSFLKNILSSADFFKPNFLKEKIFQRHYQSV